MSRWVQFLLQQLHNEAVVDKLAKTRIIQRAAESAHSLVKAAKEQSQSVQDDLARSGVTADTMVKAAEEKLVRPMSMAIRRAQQRTADVWKDAQEDWKDIQTTLGGGPPTTGQGTKSS